MEAFVKYIYRPEDLDGRLEKEVRVYDFLDKLAIPYERIDHEPLMTMEECLNADEALGIHVCKNLLLCNRQKTQFYLLMIPGDKKFKTKEISSQINSARLSFADGDDMERMLDITPGSLSVMGLMNDSQNEVVLLIDEDVLSEDYVGCHPCINTSTIKISTKDLIEIFLTKVNNDFIKVVLKGEEN